MSQRPENTFLACPDNGITGPNIDVVPTSATSYPTSCTSKYRFNCRDSYMLDAAGIPYDQRLSLEFAQVLRTPGWTS